jgi:redox-sensitive bicupin YhaK (pirin superfamily)
MTDSDSSASTHDPHSASIDLVIRARPRDLGGFTVGRVLPFIQRRRVGPFTFFDHMGPARMPAGQGMDVRPHPHIGLATVTYLFEGEIIHRDSLGSHQAIRPGDVNWMLAGRGIVHSERSSAEARASGVSIHGIQSWLALPLANEENAPSFEHHPAHTIPTLERNGVTLDVIAGTALGARSPVSVLCPTLYVHARMPAGTSLSIDTEHQERAVYVVEGRVTCDGEDFEAGSLIVLRAGRDATLTAHASSRLMLIGGATLDGERLLYWNFVASTQARLEQAKHDWRERRFPAVPGDDVEFIPLPEE